MSISYKESGVDIEKGDLFVERIQKMVKSTYNQQVVSGVGGFCALYALDTDRYLASSTDGVGTKIKLAIELNKHDTIGIDLVAMCVNDLICSGARPLFFLDYFASSKLDLDVSESVLKGIVDGCLQSQMALIGGETAEMPGMYQPGDYDLAGFSVGEVKKNDLIDGLSLTEGDSLVGIASTGFHSNGYSLVRKILETKNASTELKKECLVPTKIYVKTILSLLNNHKSMVKGIANITGSGFLNIPRINDKFDYFVNKAPALPEFMNKICVLSGLDLPELHRTFNMGVGMVVATNKPDEMIKALIELGEKAFLLGNVKKGSGKIFLNQTEL
ncbi:MAG: phosphoribosylformylglycinamidine cyclo-ligase [Bacteriovorax sp.]|jgi:phosphoribosylformylglycinamidine cyclo-ligase